MARRPDDATVGNKVLVNGRFAPYLDVSAGPLPPADAQLLAVLQLRLRAVRRPAVRPDRHRLAACSPTRSSRQDILLGPAQRADVVVDFRRRRRQARPARVDPAHATARPPGIGTREAALMQFRVRGTPAPAGARPVHASPIAAADPHVPAKVAMTWTFGLSKRPARHLLVDQRQARSTRRRVDHRVPLGQRRAVAAAQHQRRSRTTSTCTRSCGARSSATASARRPWERGYEDTWRLDPGETWSWSPRGSPTTPATFMIHCHMLDHEDDGMMATFDVVR